uniref:Probable 2-oxo-3-(5-oxofuran-2-ylidene)propanoate lactonase n=1 Tax=Bradyrhizobium sp. TaxID=376 RepID=NAAC_BRASZ|nr:RecName: Full=Probable 2-oxo-3-(5-oxofuran-2-ylidene)propanoate lactonase; AltName: Full=5-nitroanthranilic acid degradation protein C; AltName: Full=Lactone hydrolase NaaC [Bradyrhizobium sp.]AEH76925.1 lactonase [Bradyrhizobium sp. JS329]
MATETIAMDWVDIGTNGESRLAYLARPVVTGRLPAVIVMPAIHGINTYIKDVAIDLAKAGFVALLIDIHSPEQEPDLSNAEKIQIAVETLDDRKVLKDVDAAVRYLEQHAAVRADRLGILGFCVGGTYALLAARTPAIRVSVGFYGLLEYQSRTDNKPVSPLDSVAQFTAPILFHVGDKDPWIDSKMLAEFTKRMQQHQKSYELCIYRGAGHAFHEHFRDAYRPIAAQSAWNNTLIYLRWHLCGKRTV